MEKEFKSIPIELDQYLAQVWETVKDYDLTTQDGKKLFLTSILSEIHNGAKMQKHFYDMHQEAIEKGLEVMKETADMSILVKNKFKVIEKLLTVHTDCLTTLMKK